MIDQSHNIEGKIDAMIQSVMNIQTAYAKALLVDEDAAGGGAARGRRARRAPRAARGLRDRRAPAARAACARSSASRPTRSRRSASAGHAERLARASAARPASRARTSSSERRPLRIALFVTCIGDTISPEAPAARRRRCWSGSGTRSSSPPSRRAAARCTLNSGYRGEALAARAPVRRALRARSRPSSRRRRRASATVRELYPALAAEARRRRRSRGGRASWRRASSSCRSCSSAGSASRTSAPRSRTASPTTRRATRCASRASATRRSGCSRAVRGLELVELRRAEECCGFGGTFAVKNADTSSAILADKCAAIEATGAEVCTAVDSSCLLQIGGGLSRRGAARAHDAPRRDPRRDGAA